MELPLFFLHLFRCVTPLFDSDMFAAIWAAHFMTELRRRMLAATGGIQCGLRISEAAQIKLADIDCERRLIWVRRQYSAQVGSVLDAGQGGRVDGKIRDHRACGQPESGDALHQRQYTTL
jgi:integrase